MEDLEGLLLCHAGGVLEPSGVAFAPTEVKCCLATAGLKRTHDEYLFLCFAGNPLLKYLKNWTFGETAADYQVAEHTCILFLQLRCPEIHLSSTLRGPCCVLFDDQNCFL